MAVIRGPTKTTSAPLRAVELVPRKGGGYMAKFQVGQFIVELTRADYDRLTDGLREAAEKQ